VIAVGIFWSSLGLILGSYLVFPILVLVRGALARRSVRCGDATPRLSVVVVAHNEEEHIGARIEDLLAQDYPTEAVEIIVGSDGSDDRTESIARSYADRGVSLVASPRRGKIPTLNDAVACATGELLVFTDANTRFRSDALRRLVRPFADPEVGGVAGNQVYTRGDAHSATADGELAYWSFDRLLKQAQSRAGSITSATGALYAIRRAQFRPVPEGVTDDFVISTRVIAQGRRLVFAADAVAIEPVAVGTGTEFRRKVRVITQGLHAVRAMRELLDPFRHGFYSFQLAWHKLARRLIVLPMLAVLLVFPWLWTAGPLYRGATIAIFAFLALALAGFSLRRTQWARWKLLTLPFYFCLVNLAALFAVLNVLRGRRIGLWAPSRENDPAGVRECAEQRPLSRN
jgi:cellulose synthase/poly-beta-1,6-N-acetylglucosamine synthase-like glycosyltransferase